MGREIRHVPRGWEHPKNDKGEHLPLYDQTYKGAADEWIIGFTQWLDGTHEDIKYKDEYPYYWEWDDPPDKEYYRPEYDSPPVCFQIYETVTEGTPVSPVFETKDQMSGWLLGQGYSKAAVEQFIKMEWAPSMVFSFGEIKQNIEALG